MNQIKSIKLYSKLISIEHNGMNNQVARHFEDLEYLNTINIQYAEILFIFTTQRFLKLNFTEVIDVRFGRSTKRIDVRFGRSTKRIIENQFIITAHCKGTSFIIPFSLKCICTELNGL